MVLDPEDIADSVKPDENSLYVCLPIHPFTHPFTHPYRDQLGIDMVLDPEDIADTVKPDEKSMIAYLSLFFSKFANLLRKQVCMYVMYVCMYT